MEKAKYKGRPKAFWQYFVDEYILFRRDFFHKPQVAPEIVAEKLDHLDYDNNSFWHRERRIQAHIVKVSDEWRFELIAEQPSQNHRNFIYQRYSQSARAEGTVYAEEAGQTVLEGTVVVGGWQYWLGVIISVLVLLVMFGFTGFGGFGGGYFSFFGLIYLVVLGYSWFQMYEDRNYLVKLVEQAVESANERIYG